MKKTLTFTTTVEVTPVKLRVFANVRYWEDAEVDGVEDINGTRIPFREGDTWVPVIDLAIGRIIGWPQGTTAKIHYKVCDCGRYYLEDAEGKQIKYKSDYVPDDLLCIGGRGYGDYIILEVNEEGFIQEWKPIVDEDEWELV